MRFRQLLTALGAVLLLSSMAAASPQTDSIRASAQSIIANANAIDAAVPPPPPPAASGCVVAWPFNNQVIQKIGAAPGSATFKVRWRGPADTVRIKNGSTVVAENATGQFNAIAPGWYDLELSSAGTVCDRTKVGVGNVVITAGQSNNYSPREPDAYTAMASRPGLVIVSDNEGQDVKPNGWSTESMTFLDAGVTRMRHSIAWIHCFNILNRSYPTMIVNRSVGSTSTYDWRYNGAGLDPPGLLMNNLLRDLLTYSPQLVTWNQGETPAQDGAEFANMDAMMAYLHRVNNTPWLMALNSGYPAGSVPAVRSAQAAIIGNFAAYSTRQGPDVDTIFRPNSHFQGNADPAQDGLLKLGQAWATAMTANGF